MKASVKPLVDFATTVVEALPLFVVSFEPAAPFIKLSLYGIAFASTTWRYLSNRKRMKENHDVQQQ